MRISTIVMISLLILPLIALSSAAEDICTNKTNHLCCSGKPGTNGIPGMHGIQGTPGRDGRDGRDGTKGDRGSPGKAGPRGPAGVEGEKGDKGDPGAQGPAGEKGQRGEKGESGTPGSPPLASHMNWKECTWSVGDYKDQGLIKNCEFMKSLTDTALHVYFAGNLMISGCDACCSRWYFTFNGAECGSPGSIAGAFYMQTGKSHSLHRHRHIEGHCDNIHKGKVRVRFWVGSCNTGYAVANAFTGWATISRIFVEEVPKAQQ